MAPPLTFCLCVFLIALTLFIVLDLSPLVQALIEEAR
jgi:hypothetical protein